MMTGKLGDRRGGGVKYCNNTLPCSKSINPFGRGLLGCPGATLKGVNRFPRSQQMALIALRNIRCIDYLAYVSIFTLVIFLLEKNFMFFFFARKSVDACMPATTTFRGSSPAFLAGKKSLRTRISTTTSQPFN